MAFGGFVLLALMLVAPCGAKPEGEPLSPDAPYRAELSEPLTFDVEFSVIVTAPYHTHLLKVWLPIPPSDRAQSVSASTLSTFPLEVEPQFAVESRHGNRFAYFEFHDPQGAQIIRHQYQATLHNLFWEVDPEMVEKPAAWPESFTSYLEPEPVADAADFHRVLSAIVPRPTNTAVGLYSAMNWIDANLSYDHSAASLRADADHAFSLRRGHCSDYHGLCATMGRTLGFPTRVTYGLALTPKNSPSHCKLEAYLPPYGWVSFDLSETQKMVQAIHASGKLTDTEKTRLAEAARSRLKQGFRENSWLLVTRGTNYELAPPASGPVAVVRTIYAEADGAPLPEPDPADPTKREFAWMTSHKYTPHGKVVNPFKDFATLGEAE
jgi:transglutaminase-like putative cysteine protease